MYHPGGVPSKVVLYTYYGVIHLIDECSELLEVTLGDGKGGRRKLVSLNEPVNRKGKESEPGDWA